MKLVLLRHGATDLNAGDRFQSRIDLDLSPEGRRQVEAAGAALDPAYWSAIYCSPLRRAVETARLVAGRLQMPYRSWNGLEERDLGRLDGLERAACARDDPGLIDRLLNDPEYTPPGGESIPAALSRFRAALADLLHEEPPSADRAVLVVTHGGIVNLLGTALLGRPLADRDMVATCQAVAVDLPAGDDVLAARVVHWNVDLATCQDPGPATSTETTSHRLEEPWPSTSSSTST